MTIQPSEADCLPAKPGWGSCPYELSPSNRYPAISCPDVKGPPVHIHRQCKPQTMHVLGMSCPEHPAGSPEIIPEVFVQGISFSKDRAHLCKGAAHMFLSMLL